jgi:hypothetical protein
MRYNDMNKKIIAILIFLTFIFLTLNVSGFYIIKNDNNAPPVDNPTIYEFDWGIIRSSYKIKSYNNKNSLVLNSYKYNRTLIITGLGWEYAYREIPNRTFGTIAAWKIIATKFIGYCRDGRVFGFGYKKIEFE